MDKEMAPVEIVRDGDIELAYIVRRDLMPAKTQFLTPDSLGQQMGMIVYAAGTSIPRHVHLPMAHPRLLRFARGVVRLTFSMPKNNLLPRGGWKPVMLCC
jgi:hypothetical protein